MRIIIYSYFISEKKIQIERIDAVVLDETDVKKMYQDSSQHANIR